MSTRLLVFLFLMLQISIAVTAVSAQGRKMGLLVGINGYDDVKISRLESCVNDAVNMKARLENRYGFAPANLTLLTDGRATRKNILDFLSYYKNQVKAGDLFVFYYSGHGSVFPDANSLLSDETDQFEIPGYVPKGYYDSAIVPVDAPETTSGKAWKNLILDDELNEIFAGFTAKGAQVIFISDSCHAGTLAKNLSPEQNAVKLVSPKALGFDPEMWRQAAQTPGRKSGETFNRLLLVIGSSQDNQFSTAGRQNDMSLFTKIFIASLDRFAARGEVFTYRSVLNTVRPEVNKWSSGAQTPRLDGRFFTPSLLDDPIFSLPQQRENDDVRVVVKIVDEQDYPISAATFGVFPAGAKIGKGEVQKKDILMAGKTDQKGLFSSDSQTLPMGRYQVKVVKVGYRAFMREMEFVPVKNNTVVFIFKLLRE